MNEQLNFDGYWSDLKTGVVYNGKDGGDGSMPRDIYEDDKEFQRRSALHNEVVPLFLQLQSLEYQESRLKNSLANIHLKRAQCMERLRNCHRLADIC